MSETKEAMQNTIKNLQAKSEFINKLQDKGSSVVVLQLGSHTIKMGFANAKVPFTIRPFIAYKKNSIKTTQMEQQSPMFGQYQDNVDFQSFRMTYQNLQQKLRSEGVIMGEGRTKGKPKSKAITMMEQIQQPNMAASILYGQQALWVEDNPNYIFKKILKHGFFNVEKEEDLRHCLNDLNKLLRHMLLQMLKIPQKQWGQFNCILVIPDVFIRKHIKGLINVLFAEIGFKKLYVHLQSIMACFGTAVNSACVVDIGHEKISVCCVDQGVIVPKSLVRKNFGLVDVSKCLIKIFNDKLSRQGIELEIRRQGDLNEIDKIKQLASSIRDGEQTTNKIYEVGIIREGKKQNIQIAYSDSICIVSNSFFSNMWNSFKTPDITQPFNSYSKLFDLWNDPEDYFEQFSGGGQIYEVNESHPNFSKKLTDPFYYVSLQTLILQSLNSIKDHKKFAENILVIGGGAHLYKLTQECISLMMKQLEGENSFGDKVQLSTDLFLREILPIHASWLGGSVIPKLDSLRDLWIERNKYLGQLNMDIGNEDEEDQVFDRKLFTRKQQSQEWGIKYLKEKIPFLW